MELFPERDGNRSCASSLCDLAHRLSEWSSSLKGMETQGEVQLPAKKPYFVRMELFPERDGNSLTGSRSAHTQIKVRMELFPERDGNDGLHERCPNCLFLVRMELFPERDGNCDSSRVRGAREVPPSEWRSSLNGMETCPQPGVARVWRAPVRMEVFPERDGNEYGAYYVANWLFAVRMELFRERDGNLKR